MYRSTGAVLAPFLLLFGLVSSAQAEDTRIYGTISLGVSVPDATFGGVRAESGSNGDFGLALGVQTSDYFRWDIADVHYMNFAGTDLGFGTSRSNLSFGTTLNWGYFSPTHHFHPFISLGIGPAILRYQATGTNAIDTDWAFEWNVGGGFEVQSSERFKTGIRYRYRATNRNTASTPYSLDMHSLSLELIFMGGP